MSRAAFALIVGAVLIVYAWRTRHGDHRAAFDRLCRRLRTTALRAWIAWRLGTLQGQMHFLAEQAYHLRDELCLPPLEWSRYRVQLNALAREREQLLQRRAAL